jgi:superfamily II DNA/RNA helicase
VQDIAHVINYDLPDVAENFIHRVGRTGRAGEVGVATTLYERGQRREVLLLEKTLGIHMEKVVAEHVPADKFEKTHSTTSYSDVKPGGVKSHFARHEHAPRHESRDNSRNDFPRHGSRHETRHSSRYETRGGAGRGGDSSRARIMALPGEVFQVQAGD